MLRRAGYSVRLQEFTFPFFRDLAPGTLSQVAPTPTNYETGTFDYSASGDVTGTVIPIDVEFPPAGEAGTTDSGCEPADFPAPPTGPAVALIQRGTCTFEVKAANAAAAGYDAAVIFNEGQVGRTELFVGTLGNPQPLPVVGLSYPDAQALYTATQAGTVTVRIVTSTEVDPERTTYNVVADTPAGVKDEVVVVGAHLDSVVAGPGINDNGSGSATILEIAEQMAELGLTDKLQRRVRFAFWGAEENNLLGSQYYVDSLRPNQLARHYANLNFDMVGSPNYVRFVYDGDGSIDPATRPSPARPDRRRSRTCSTATSPVRAWPPNRPRSTDARTTARSSPQGFRPAGCSPERRESRPPRRPRPMGAPQVSPTTGAITKRATPSAT